MPRTETQYRLDTFAQATIGASGTATATIGPTLNGERWEINIMSAKGAAAAKLEVFRGTIKVDGTDRADNDTSSTDLTLMQGENLTFVWSSGTVGVTMQCYVSGDRYVPGKRAY